MIKRLKTNLIPVLIVLITTICCAAEDSGSGAIILEGLTKSVWKEEIWV